MKKGIKNRLVWSYLVLIIFTVAVFETIILSALFMYYQEGIKQTLRDQGKMFISFYELELSGEQFEENAQQYLSRYQFLVNAQVQLIDREGNIIAEREKSEQSNLQKYEDIQAALKGEQGYYSGEWNGERTLSVSIPLAIGGENVGVIRFTTSMEQFHELFLKNMTLLLSIGGIVILFALILSFFLAHTITRPVRSMTKAAQQMAAGEFSTVIHKEKDDEIGQLADTLNYMAQQVLKHEQMKNEFIASVSHDLRTPLTSIKGWSVTLHSMTQDELLKEGLEIISNESDRLTIMVSDLLDLSSLTSGKLSFTFTEVSLVSLANEVVQQLKPRADKKGISLQSQMFSSTSNSLSTLKINGDPNRLKQALINLLDNALKFTPEGGRITVTLEKTRDEAVLSIQDTGIGIGQNQLKVVKEKFVKGKEKGAGTGLGLAICEEIIKAHNGLLILKSEQGKGTTVHISLPLYKKEMKGR
ncbi:ATP-binding protein [Niallia oryzisoli]|uniref:histidine kinase n=1 Tax=Niallia oryzisoli TaxID=1737571 RepID=A0ABZ2C7N5_9BACI